MPNTLGTDAEFISQLMERHTTRPIVVHFEPTLRDDPFGSVVELTDGGGNTVMCHLIALRAFDDVGRLKPGVAQIGDRPKGLFAVMPR